MNAHEKQLIDRMIDHFEAIRAAQIALEEAKESMKKTWNEEKAEDNIFPPETVIALHNENGNLYQVDFDYEEWKPPTIRRIEHHTALYIRE